MGALEKLLAKLKSNWPFSPYDRSRDPGHRGEGKKEEKPLTLPDLKDYAQPEFMDWEKSVGRLRRRVKLFAHELVARPEMEYLPLRAFSIALCAQIETLERINDKYLNCAVPWDPTTKFPSISAIAADANLRAKNCTSGEGDLKTILESFGGWSVFSREEILCACGKGGPALRTVEYDVMIHHAMRVVKGGLIVKQIVGVKSRDYGHLKHHYGFKTSSRRVDNLEIIWMHENRIEWRGNRLVLESAPLVHCPEANERDGLAHAQTDEFRAKDFTQRIVETSGLPASRGEGIRVETGSISTDSPKGPGVFGLKDKYRKYEESIQKKYKNLLNIKKY